MDLYIVQAEFSFKGENNDELCFNKGDVITVTQQEEGGWWEGTLGEKTGWFPSNYVNKCKCERRMCERQTYEHVRFHNANLCDIFSLPCATDRVDSAAGGDSGVSLRCADRFAGQ